MTASMGFILCFMLGVACGIRWVHASRLDKADKLVATIIRLRAELAAERQQHLIEDIWLSPADEDDT